MPGPEVHLQSSASQNVANYVRQLWAPNAPAVVGDGGLGTTFRDEAALEGIQLVPVLWSATALLTPRNRQILRGNHRDFNKAVGEGAISVCIANSFRTQAHVFQAAGLSKREALQATRNAVEIALKARDDVGNPNIVVGFSQAPLDDCYNPTGRFSRKQLERGHLEHAEAAVEAGGELMVCETVPSKEEGEEALKAAQKIGVPAIISYYTSGDGTVLPTGESLADAAYGAEQLGAVAVGGNCIKPSKALRMAEFLTRLPNFHLPVTIAPQGYEAGCPEIDANVSPEDYPAHIRKIIGQCLRLGVRGISGCCNVTPNDIEAMAIIAQGESGQFATGYQLERLAA
jgi:homocysteine S-methyltransferase